MTANLQAHPIERGSQSSEGWQLAGPAALALLALIIVPAASVFFVALTDWQFGARTFSYVGLQNYRELFADPDFYKSLRNTFVYCLIVVPGTVLVGLAIALLVESGRSLRTFYRAVHFLPFMATLAAMAVAWEALLHPTIGLLNQSLAALGLPTANWLRDPSTALVTLAAIAIWKNLGFAMVLFMAGLKAIPRDLYDAADIDGAGGATDRLQTVTLPMLGPTMLFVVIVTALRALETFDTVNILTQGGPARASEMLLYTLYVESFGYLQAGRGAAITVVFLIIVVSLTLLQMKVMDKRVHYS